jgi:hypothetical protein
MMQNGVLYQLSKWEHPTLDGGGFLLPTPTRKHGSNKSPSPGAKKRRSLEQLAREGLLPTPTCNDAHNHPSTPSQWDRKDSLNVEAAKLAGYTRRTIGTRKRLNPSFVEWMMGLEMGHTDVD